MVAVTACLTAILTTIAALHPRYQALPSLREQATIQDSWREERLRNVPNILHKYGVDAWLMSQREYAEDIAFWSIKKATQFSARRRTVDLFFANAPEGASNRYQIVDETETIFDKLQALFEKHQPRAIALNVDPDIAFAGGLHVGLYNELVEHLPANWTGRFVEAPMVAVEYIATMPSSQLKWYKRLQETTWAMISEAFSEKVIQPGKTTTEDVEWWLRDKIQAMYYSTWFHPSVTILLGAPDQGSERTVIEYHDILHVDFGVTALGLNTDTQHLAYVLGPGETEKHIPRELRHGLAKVNRLQDIVRKNMVVGKTGNEILRASQEDMKSEGIRGKIYCHPIGDWGHAAGTLIGMTNHQDGIPVLGDMPLLNRTYYSIELYAEHFVPEKNGTINFYQEEDVYWVDKNDWNWVYGQQTEFLTIKSDRDPAYSDGLKVQQ